MYILSKAIPFGIKISAHELSGLCYSVQLMPTLNIVCTNSSGPDQT